MNNKSKNLIINEFNYLDISEITSILLDITEAGIKNYPVYDLFKMVELMLNNHFDVKKIKIYFRKEDKWEEIITSGTPKYNAKQSKKFADTLIKYKSLTYINVPKPSLLAEYNVIIPVSSISNREDTSIYAVLGEYNWGSKKMEALNLKFIKALINIIGIAYENNSLIEQRINNEGLKKDMHLAAEAQSMFFPKILPDNKYVEMSATYLPFRQVSGDYYDYIPINDNEFILCIADVSGKGVHAALLMANFQASLRALSGQRLPLHKLVITLNKTLYDITHGDRFVTLIIGHYYIKERKLSYINAGHTPALFLRGNNIKTLSEGTTILGAFEELPFLVMAEENLIEGDLILCYTDGVLEFNNDDIHSFTLNDLKILLKSNANKKPSQINELIMNKIKSLINDRHTDDISLLTARFY